MRNILVLFVVLVVAAAALLGAAMLGKPRPLAGTVPSPAALASAVLDALQHQDQDALRRLALSEEEFRTHVWPALPAARPERNLTVEYVWGDLVGKSRAYLSSHLNRPVPAGARLTRVAFDGEATNYGSFRVYRRSRIELTDPDGRVHTVRVFGSMIEKDGQFKVFSYVTD